MIKICLTLIVALILSTQADAQNLIWSKTFGSTWYDGASAIALTNDGGIVLAGFAGYAGYQNVLLMKTDQNGNLIWSRSFLSSGTSANAMKQTFDGGFILTGKGPAEAFLIKTDSLGIQQWQKSYVYPGGIDSRGHSVYQTSDSGYIIAGQVWIMHGQFGNYDMFVVKTDKNGNEEWMKIYYREEQKADVGMAVEQLQDGGYILGGFTQSTYWSSYVLRIDHLGNVIWSNIYPGPWQSECYDIQATPDGGFIMTGIETTYSTDGDVMLTKLNANGGVEWKKIYGGTTNERGNSIHQVEDGYIICGQTTYGLNSYSMYLLRTNLAGDTLWTRIIGGNGDDRGFAAMKSPNGDIYSAGVTWSFGLGRGDVFLARVNDNDITTSIQQNEITVNDFILYQNFPNPFNPVSKISFNIPEQTKVTLKVYDFRGREIAIMINNEIRNPGVHTIDFDGGRFASGIYFYRLITDNFIATKKMVLVK